MGGMFPGIIGAGALCLSIGLVNATEIALPQFDVPLLCQFPDECVVQNYVDLRPGPGVRDYRCGMLSYERHRGTDFRVLKYNMYAEGVPVIAAADGVVRRIRDGQKDGVYLKDKESVSSGEEGGNEVELKHKGGWQTLYAHLRNGSIAVKAGDKVKAGDVLGVIGLSGKSEFTHLHFHVMLDNKFYDPFTRTEIQGCKQKSIKGFWSSQARERLAYISAGVVETGFSSEIPHPKELPFSKERKRIALRPKADVLVFWVDYWGGKIADRFTLTYSDPAGKVTTNQKILKKSQISRFAYLGKERPPEGWLSGKYVGEAVLERIVDGHWKTVFSSKQEITIP